MITTIYHTKGREGEGDGDGESGVGWRGGEVSQGFGTPGRGKNLKRG